MLRPSALPARMPVPRGFQPALMTLYQSHRTTRIVLVRRLHLAMKLVQCGSDIAGAEHGGR